MAKRSIAQRMKDRTRDLGVAEGYIGAGKQAPRIGGAVAPKPTKAAAKPKKRK